MDALHQKDHEPVNTLAARVNDLATCPESSFDPELAMNVLDDAIGGSLASETRRAGIVDFSSEELDHLEEVVRRFDSRPPAMNDTADLELYTNMIEEAEMLIGIRRDQLTKEAQYGSREARIKHEMQEQQGKQQRLFLESSRNTLNAAGDLSRKSERKRVG